MASSSRRFLGLLAMAVLAFAGPLSGPAVAQDKKPARTEAGQASVRDEPARKGWGIVCNEQDDCKSSIRLPIDKGGGELELWIGKAGPKDRYLGVMTPLGIHIPSGVAISFDRGKSAFAKLNLVDCKPIGCRAVVALSKKLEENLRRKEDVAVILKDSESRNVIGLLVTLDGFSTGMDKLASR